MLCAHLSPSLSVNIKNFQVKIVGEKSRKKRYNKTETGFYKEYFGKGDEVKRTTYVIETTSPNLNERRRRKK